MRLYQMDVTQTDCPHVKTSSKFPSIYIIIMNTQFRANYQNMFTIFYSYDPVELEKGIDYFTTRERVQDFELISKRDNIISTYYKYTTTSLFKTIREVGFRLHPMIVHKGIERWYFISEEDREVTEDSINEFIVNKIKCLVKNMHHIIVKLQMDRQTGDPIEHFARNV